MKPFPYQQACLDQLEAARNDGHQKALVVMATGLGKTVVSAFEVKRLLQQAPGRVLYLCHNNDILRQARRTFEEILGSNYTYGYFHGTEKHLHKVDLLFGSFQTMVTWREAFMRDEFRYVVVDEFHHAHAATFRPTVEYFEPDFMIGLTATPERGDGLDITQLLGKPVFELGVFKALAQRHLCDVDYRVMTDEIQNLGVLDTPVGKLSIAELNRTIFIPKRDEEIVRIIGQKTADVQDPRVMIFCSSIEHAERMASLMPHAAIVHSKLKIKERNQRLDAFRHGSVDTILTVDMLNEGIDVPEANVIVFLRSTSSRTIFLQQLGRGLRKAAGKLKVLVLDFVANCKRFEMIDQLQQGVKRALEESRADSYEDEEAESTGQSEPLVLTLDGITFDERVWEVFGAVRTIRDRRSYTEEELKDQLLNKAESLGRSPIVRDVNEDPNMPGADAFYGAFNTQKWNQILRTVGLLPVSRKDYSRGELTDQLLAKAGRLGRAPTTAEVAADPEMAAVGTFTRVFDTTWDELLLLVGIEPISMTKRRKLTAQLLRKAEELGRAPSRREVSADPEMASASTFQQAFETNWNGVLEIVGLAPTRKVGFSTDELKSQLIAKANQLGRPPTRREVDADPTMASAGTFKRVFDTDWEGLLEEAGLTPRSSHFSIESLTDQLRHKAEKLGRAPSYTEVCDDPEMVHPETFKSVFDTDWDGVVKALGMAPQTRSRYSVDDLKAQLLRKAEELGRAPSVNDVKQDPHMAAVSTFQNAFKKPWSGVLKTVGLPPSGRRDRKRSNSPSSSAEDYDTDHSDYDLHTYLRQLTIRLQRIPTEGDVKKAARRKDGIGLSVFLQRFGSLPNALNEAGIITKRSRK